MSVVGKSTCSGFKTGLDISYHDGNDVKYIKQRGNFIKDARISGYFDTKYTTVLRIEQILHNFEDQKFANFFNLKQVNFRMTFYLMNDKAIIWVNSLLPNWNRHVKTQPIKDMAKCISYC